MTDGRPGEGTSDGPAHGDPARPGAMGRLLLAPDVLAAIMLLALCIVTVIDVVGRYVFRAPIGGADEISVFLMAIAVYAVLPAICWREGHVCVDIIDLVYPRRLIAIRQILINLAGAAMMGALTWRMWFQATRLSEDGEVTMFLRLPKGPLAYLFVASCAIATLLLVANVIRYALGRGPMQQHPNGSPIDSA